MTLCEIEIMIVGWIKNMISSILPEDAAQKGQENKIGQGAKAFEEKAKDKLIDSMDETAFSREAQQKSLNLMSIIQKGGVPLEKLPMKLNARRKVQKNIVDFYDMDEITEKVIGRIEEDSEDPI